ncbi:MAG TPA: MgtC/SapB family protein [Armatimonadota bacterium]|jgi:putative Mg2+ transporter-C (MgtC) family protein
MDRLIDLPFLFPGWPSALLRLALAFALGALLGLERERRQRPAGLRTHALVSLTSALVMLLAAMMPEGGGSEGRVAQGILTGMGFLGAGTILRHENTVTGLTTAASLWITAALGMAAGSGQYALAVGGGAAAFIALSLMHHMELRIRRETGPVQVEALLAPGLLYPLGLHALLDDNEVELVSLRIGETPDQPLALVVEPARNLSRESVLALLQSSPDLSEVRLATRPSRSRYDL